MLGMSVQSCSCFITVEMFLASCKEETFWQ